MTPKDEALRIVQSAIIPPTEVEEVPLTECLGRVLARDVKSDIDMPPFNRSAMDGYALQSASAATAPATLEVLEVIKAGTVPTKVVGPGQASKIMTGAPVPEGADAVVMVEWTQADDDGNVTIDRVVEPGAHIARQGEDIARDEVVLRASTPLRPIEVGLLATVGCAPVPVWKRPTVAVIATGDELVDPAEGPPGPGQIRESNGGMLTALVKSLGLGITCDFLGIARDDPESTGALLERGFEHDVLILSGGVSMGDYDIVSEELSRRGKEVLLESVAIKPGKPLLVVRFEKPGGGTGHAFGLPGNPVSSFATFELFVRPFLNGLTGRLGPHLFENTAVVRGDVRGKAIRRCQHLPARVTLANGELEARAVEWHGSGDLRGLADANAFIVVDVGAAPPRDGERTEVLLLGPDLLRVPPHRSRGED